MAQYSADIGRTNTSISASNSNAAGDEFALVRGPRHCSKVTMQISEVNGGAYSAFSARLEVSNADVPGSNDWMIHPDGLFTTALAANGTDAVSGATEGYRWFRARKVSSTTSSGTPLVTAKITFGA